MKLNHKSTSRQIHKAGYDLMSKSSILICGIARDCASQLNNLIPKLENLAALFKDYKIIVVENDSQDDTAKVILSWVAKNHNVLPILFSENKAVSSQQNTLQEKPGDFNYSRISRITYARNLYLTELCNHKQTDFVIVVDLDILDFSIPGIANSFGQMNEWDCATSCGLRYTLRTPFRPTIYWDTFAFEPKEGFTDGVQNFAEIRANQKIIREKLRENKLVPALSAFGGLAIYRYQSLLDCEYEVLTNSDPDVPVLCEHVALHRLISCKNTGYRLVINPLQELRYESPMTTIVRNFRTVLLGSL